jgi:hypothetical protein
VLNEEVETLKSLLNSIKRYKICLEFAFAVMIYYCIFLCYQYLDEYLRNAMASFQSQHEIGFVNAFLEVHRKFQEMNKWCSCIFGYLDASIYDRTTLKVADHGWLTFKKRLTHGSKDSGKQNSILMSTFTGIVLDLIGKQRNGAFGYAENLIGHCVLVMNQMDNLPSPDVKVIENKFERKFLEDYRQVLITLICSNMSPFEVVII